jgi:hypothetical protein
MREKNKTRIVVCAKCGIRTRHEWQQWERQSLLLRFTGHIQLVEGWVCTKCGRQSNIRRIGAERVSAHT